MIRLPDDGTLVLHLCNTHWESVDWDAWISFRGYESDRVPLPNVGRGEHFFVVCIVEDGRLFNMLPHRYLIDEDGRIADDRYFGVLSDDEIKRYESLDRRHYEYPQTTPFSATEEQEFKALRKRLWQSWLPPADTVRELTRAATALPDENDAAWHFLEACGLTRRNSNKPS